jgi:hypothetical protein
MTPRLRLLRRERRLREMFFVRLVVLSLILTFIVFVTL